MLLVGKLASLAETVPNHRWDSIERTHLAKSCVAKEDFDCLFVYT
jgi:hypothetical protein